MMNYANPDLDALWVKAKVEGDPVARNKELAEMQGMLMRDVAWLPVVEFKTQFGLSDKVSGLTWVTDNSPRFYDLKY
jgi:peptide/nickel transport system substrate-binding protein